MASKVIVSILYAKSICVKMIERKTEEDIRIWPRTGVTGFYNTSFEFNPAIYLIFQTLFMHLSVALNYSILDEDLQLPWFNRNASNVVARRRENA